MASLIRRYLNRAVVVWAASLLVVACSKDDQKPGGGLDEGSVAIELFEASETTVDAGEPVVLRWKTRNAESIEIVDSVGGVIGIPPGEDGLPPVEEGEVTVHPEVTTTFILTAKGSAGSATELLQITVRGSEVPRTTVSLEADSDRVDAGQPVVLTWSAQNANRVILREGRTVILDEREQKSGTLEVRPGVTTTYAIEAMGIGPSATDEVVVEVQPVIEAFFVATEGPVRSNSQIELRWETLGAAALRVETDEGFRYDVEEADLRKGSLLTAAGAGTFRLVATSGELRAEEEASVEISDLPLIVNFGAGPNVTASEEMPAEVTLTWNVRFATEIEIEAIPGGNLPVPVGMLEEGSLDVPVTGPVSFRLVASNEEGSVEETAEVIVAPFPEVVAFTASHERAGFGEEIELTWETRGAVEVFITRPEGRLPIDPGLVTGSTTLAVSQSTQFVLAARNELGVEVHAFVDVTVGNPIISRFDAPLRVAPGGAVALEWEVIGGVELDVLASAGSTSHCSTKDPEQIESGSCSVTAPTEGDEVTYTLLVKDGVGGTSTEVAVVGTHDGPIIESFNAARSVITEGETVVLSWVVSDDYLGNPPELSLVDDRGNTYDMRGALAVGGISTDPIPAGKTVFTLEASTAASQRKAKRTAQVDAYARPVILAFESDPPYATAAQPNVTLSWQTENAISLHIYPIGRNGEQGDAIYSTLDPAKIANDSLPVTPTVAQPDYRIVVANAGGFTVERDLQVGVDPARVLSFTATPNELLDGGSTKLAWETEKATWASMDVKEPWVETKIPYMELEGRPNARPLPLPTGNSGFTQFRFPAGFAFPFHGTVQTSAKIFGYGYLSFHPGATIGLAPSGFPNSSGYSVSIAPYWTQLSLAGGRASLLSELVEHDDGTRSLIIEWKDFAHQNDTSARVNFQLVLHEDGGMEYRYGEMHFENPDYVNGGRASIGTQDFMAKKFALIHHWTEMPGGVSGRSFYIPATPTLLAGEEIDDYFLDITALPQHQKLTLPNGPSAGATIDPLPDGFVFPYAGEDRTNATVFRNGAIALGPRSSTLGTARVLPMMSGDGDHRGIHLAPYLHPSASNSHGGDGSYAIVSIDGRRALIIQWKGIKISGHETASSLDFQVVLYEDGSFEYRYGNMSSTDEPGLANGLGASIGFQGGADSISYGPLWGYQLLYDDEMPGGLSHRSWRFRQTPQLPADGELVVSPRGSVTYVLTAHNDHSAQNAERHVTVHPHSDIQLWAEPRHPLPGEAFDLHWRTINISNLVLSQDGQTIEVPAPEATASGSRSFPNGLARGIYTFKLRGVGAMAQATEAELELPVAEPFSILAFEADVLEVEPNAPVVLSWLVDGAESVSIHPSNGSPITGLDPNEGEITVNPSVRTTYELQAHSMSRLLTERRTIAVRTVKLENLEPSTEEPVLAGETVTLDWDMTGTEGAFFPEPITLEIAGPGTEFRDIRPTGTQLTWTSYTRPVDIPFDFPFFEETYDTLGVAKGYLALGAHESSSSSSNTIPAYSSLTPRPRIAAFWDSSLAKQTGTDPDSNVFVEHVDAGTDDEAFIVQWNKMRTTTPSGTYDLNFQIVLFKNGNFDFRYGRMEAINGSEAAVARAAGSNSSAGYQENGQAGGDRLWLNQAQEGGLSYRTFRTFRGAATIKPPLTLRPGRSHEGTICVADEHHQECRGFRVGIVQPGDLAITEVMVNSVRGVDGQWFEIRNVGGEAINLDGLELVSDAGSHTLDFEGPNWLLPGEYQVFSHSQNQDFPASTYVYGNKGFTLGQPEADGSIEVRSGAITLGGMVWQAAALPQNDRSVELNPVSHRRGTVIRSLTNITHESWCVGEKVFSQTSNALGSPGEAGTNCLSDYYEVEHLSDRQYIDISDGSIVVDDMCLTERTKAEIVGGIGFNFPFFDKIVPGDTLWATNLGGVTFTDLTPRPGPGSVGGDGFGVTSTFGTPRAGRLLGSSVNNATSRWPMTGWLAPYWAAMGFGSEGTACVFQYKHLTVDGMRGVVVQWSGFKLRPTQNWYTGNLDFQLQLWENGDIVFAYGDMRDSDLALGRSAWGTIEDEPTRVEPVWSSVLNRYIDSMTSEVLQVFNNDGAVVPYSTTLIRLKNPPAP